MKKFRNLIAVTLLTGLVLGLGACSAQETPKPDHKAKTTACLIRSTTFIAGTPEKQLAADLVEAKIVYGLAVREIQIDEDSTDVPTRLLDALQAGCVLMVSAETKFVSDLATFAKGHPNMLVLFVGGKINSSEQPTNFRWVSDDIHGGAKLAGFFAAGKSITGKVHLFAQANYFESKSVQVAFRAGVKAFDKASGSSTQVVLVKAGTSKALNSTVLTLGPEDVVAIFGGRNIWQSLPQDQVDGPYLMGADIQLGQNNLEIDSLTQVSLERNTSKYVLNAVSSLLDRNFDSDPLYRKPGALKFNTVELRISQPDSIDGALLEALNAFEQELISAANR